MSHSPTAARPNESVAAEHSHNITDGEDNREVSSSITRRISVYRRETDFETSLCPQGSRDLSFIGIQAFALGNAFTGCILLSTWLIIIHSSWWRLPAFFVCLSLFHFLEYYITARYNVPAVRASSFLLFSNGSAYTTAHALATTEIVISNFLPRYQGLLSSTWVLAIGVVLVVVGQAARSIAMAHAGTNFNHTVAQQRKDSHTLVHDGIYAYFRHPSYFGFFWWALGTQLLVGNKVCLLGYMIVLWRFFSRRIKGEERFLIQFFGKEYEDYRQRTPTYIPLVP